MRLGILVTLILLIIFVYDVASRGNRLKSRSRTRNYQSSFSRLKKSSGLSLNKKMLLASGSLAAVYVGFKMASHKDLSRYTVCEGRRIESDEAGVKREYLYTVCPSHLRYCCRSDVYEGERCCGGRSYYTYSQPQGTVLGSMFGMLIMVVGFGLIVYFCCLRPRRQKRLAMAAAAARDDMDDDALFSPNLPPPPPPGSYVSVGGRLPAFDPNVPTFPVSVGKPEDYFDKPPPYSTEPMPPAGMAPPPYPGVAQSTPSTNPPYPPAQPPPPPPSQPVPVPGSGWASAAPPPNPTAPPYPTQTESCGEGGGGAPTPYPKA